MRAAASTGYLGVTSYLQASSCRWLGSNGKRHHGTGTQQRVQAMPMKAAAAGHSAGPIPPATSTCASWCSWPPSDLWTGLCTHSASQTAASAAGSLCCLCAFDAEQGCSQLIQCCTASGSSCAAVHALLRTERNANGDNENAAREFTNREGTRAGVTGAAIQQVPHL